MAKIVTLPNGELVPVLPRSWWLFWLPTGFSITLSPNVYVPANHLEGGYETTLMNILVHENVHLHQQTLGKSKFYWKYITSRSFRYACELEAYTTQYQYYMTQKNYSYNMDSIIENTATMLSSSNYFWCVSKAKALNDLTIALKG